MWRWLPLLLALGCGDDNAGAGGRDAMVSDDARPDADPSCQQWARVEVPVVDVTMVEARPIHYARSARFLVDVRQCPEDITAPPRYGFPLVSAPSIYLSMTVWRRHVCADADAVIVRRPLTIRGFPEGDWYFDLVGGGTKKVTAVAPPAPSCNTGQTDCDEDCDCAEGVCLSTYGFGGPFARCARPCEVDRDCGGDGICATNVADDLPSVCQTGLPECGDCPEGFACTSGTCEPTFTLNSASRHTCACDSECDPGMHCAFHAGAATGRCEALCRTESGAWCEGPHVCAGSIEGVDGVCGWIGD